MSIEPAPARELARALHPLFGTAVRARIYDRRGRVPQDRKRRRRGPSPVLAEITDRAAVAGLARALRLRPDSPVMDWMQWPDLWFEFADENDATLVTVGLLRPDWLRWGSHGDVQIAAPDLLAELLAGLGLPDDGCATLSP